MNKFDWTTCLWPEDKHPMPLCRHAWERHLRQQNNGEMPLSEEMLDKQWDMILSLQGDEKCPCAKELELLVRGEKTPNLNDPSS
ncbi:MAG TPA: hypothetical protein ENH10_01740 [Bacteroidetes bacterium]|nr:hypothetical protein BMS3Bbin04_00445 [bacterium BMS3Bbin04]HDO64741.1 hypothetical protein [Bacteroidota bacterium]HEX03866.1 hypothetical protein [Bacteroidota bacterium]